MNSSERTKIAERSGETDDGDWRYRSSTATQRTPVMARLPASRVSPPPGADRTNDRRGIDASRCPVDVDDSPSRRSRLDRVRLEWCVRLGWSLPYFWYTGARYKMPTFDFLRQSAPTEHNHTL